MKNKCCLCQRDTAEEFFKDVDGFPLVRCRSCDLVYLQEVTRPDAHFIEETKEIAATAKQGKGKLEYWGFPHLYQKYQPVFDGFFEERWDRLQAFKGGFRRMLDVGCGYGFWMNFCRRKGVVDLEGIEPCEEVVVWARSKFNLTVHQTRLEIFQTDKKYDAIILCDILEHLQDPNQELSRLRNFLSPGGLLMIQVPNVLGIKYPYRPIYGLPFHLWQFKLENVRRLLEKHRFRILKSWTGTMGVIGRYEAGGPSWFEKKLWALSNTLRLGNRLIVIAST